MTKRKIAGILSEVSKILAMDPGEFEKYRYENIAQTLIPNDWFTLQETQRKYCKMWIDDILRDTY